MLFRSRGGSRCISFPSFWGNGSCPSSCRHRRSSSEISHGTWKAAVACEFASWPVSGTEQLPSAPAGSLHSTVHAHGPAWPPGDGGMGDGGMGDGGMLDLARLQGRIWFQQLQKQYRSVPRNMARMAVESRLELETGLDSKRASGRVAQDDRHFFGRAIRYLGPISAG